MQSQLYVCRKAAQQSRCISKKDTSMALKMTNTTLGVVSNERL